MDDAPGRNGVKRIGVARRPAAGGLGHLVCLRQRREIGQGDFAEQMVAAARAAVVIAAPDFLGPVGRFAVLVEQRAHLDHHRRALRLVDEFFLAAPAHADRYARLLHGDDGGVGGGIVRAVMAIAARCLHVLNENGRGVELERTRERGAQRKYALTVRPDRQPLAIIKRQTA